MLFKFMRTPWPRGEDSKSSQPKDEGPVTATVGGTSGETFRRYPRHLCHGDIRQWDSNSLLRRLSKQHDWFGAEDRRLNT